MKPTGYFHFYWNPCLRDTRKELRMIWPYRSSQLAIYWDYWEQIQLALREWCKLMIRANWLHEKRWHPISYNIILGDPGAVSQVGRKDRTKIFKYRQKSPWVMTLIELFPKIQADAVSWLCTKNALYYCAQSPTVSPEFFPWLCTRQLLSCHACPVRSNLSVQGKLFFSTFLSRNEGTTDESKKCLECYQQEQFNLPQVNNCVAEWRWVPRMSRGFHLWHSQPLDSVTPPWLANLRPPAMSP